MNLKDFITDVNKNTIFNHKSISLYIDKIQPNKTEKTTNAEVSTPYFLRQQMLNSIPISFWTTPRKVFEPCCGKGGFVVDIVARFMTGLKDTINDETERYKYILEHCLYFSDINTDNINTCKTILNVNEDFTLNYHIGDTLKLDIKEKWNICGFDAVISNPPFHMPNSKASGNSIWNLFIVYCLSIIKEKGFLCFLTPTGWRKPTNTNSRYSNLLKIMTKENQMLYLEMHDLRDGKQTFDCGTRYDWYLIEKTPIYTLTRIIDEERKTYNIDLSIFEFIPNSNFDLVEKLLHKNLHIPCKIHFTRGLFDTRKPYLSDIQDEKYKYTLIHTTPKSGTRFKYSALYNSSFELKKIIFGLCGINEVILDYEGKYGTTQQAAYIEIDSKDEGASMKKFMESAVFKQIMKSCSWSHFTVDWRLFTYFKQDFYNI